MAESQVQSPQTEGLTLEGNELSNLLNKEFKPKTDEAKGAVEQAVRTLAEQALAQTKLIGNDGIGVVSRQDACRSRQADEPDRHQRLGYAAVDLNLGDLRRQVG